MTDDYMTYGQLDPEEKRRIDEEIRRARQTLILYRIAPDQR